MAIFRDRSGHIAAIKGPYEYYLDCTWAEEARDYLHGNKKELEMRGLNLKIVLPGFTTCFCTVEAKG